MDDEYSEKLAEIPEEKRVLITSERAYQYMADRYDLKEGYIWAIDTEENGTPSQVKSLINFIEENDPPVLFIESNVDERPMETVASETGLEIFGEIRSEEHTSELQSRGHLVCRLLLEKKKQQIKQ